MVLGTLVAALTQQVYFLALGPAVLVGWLGLHDIRALYLLMLASIPFSAEVELTDTLGTDLPDEPMMWLMTLLLAVHILHRRREVLSIPIDPAILMTLVFHLVWIVFCSLLSTHVLLSVKYLAAKTWYVVAFTVGGWYCLRDREDIVRAAKVLATSICAATCLVLLKHASTGVKELLLRSHQACHRGFPSPQEQIGVKTDAGRTALFCNQSRFIGPCSDVCHIGSLTLGAYRKRIESHHHIALLDGLTFFDKDLADAAS